MVPRGIDELKLRLELKLKFEHALWLQFRDPEAKMMTKLWEKADVNMDNSLSKDEIVQLVNAMNINLDSR